MDKSIQSKHLPEVSLEKESHSNKQHYIKERYQETFGAESQYALNRKRHEKLKEEMLLVTEAKHLGPNSNGEALSSQQRNMSKNSHPDQFVDQINRSSEGDVPDDETQNAYNCSKYPAHQLFCVNKPSSHLPLKFVFAAYPNYHTCEE